MQLQFNCLRSMHGNVAAGFKAIGKAVDRVARHADLGIQRRWLVRVVSLAKALGPDRFKDWVLP